MASNIYTQTLWQVPATTAPGALLGPPVPAGFLWVIRDVLLRSPGSPSGPVACPFGAIEVNGIEITSSPQLGTLEGCTFQWSDLRQVVATTDTWSFVSQILGWKLRVGGYQLSAP